MSTENAGACAPGAGQEPGPLPPQRPPVTTGKLALRLFITAVLVAGVLGGLWYFNHFRSQMIAKFFAANRPPPVPVAVVVAKSGAVPRYLNGIGTLAAVREVVVSPEVSGRVTAITFEPGSEVRGGDALVQLNDRPEQADLQRYRALAKLAELNLARAKEMLSRKVGPQTTVDQQQANLDEANANIAHTQALIAQKTVRAPFEGVLGVRQVELGQILKPGDPIVTLTDLSRLYINFTLPEQDRARLAVGQKVAVTNDAFPGRNFDGVVTTIEPQVNADTRAIKVQATMGNPGKVLLPGMFANVRVLLAPQTGVVTVPETAVDYTLYGDSVYVVKADGKDASGRPKYKAVRTFVETGTRFGGRVAIRSGIKAGERVVSSGQIRLSNGAAVTVTKSDALVPSGPIPLN